jgi:hypothetical protein
MARRTWNLIAEAPAMLEVLREHLGEHYESEDGYLSCPKAPGFQGGDGGGCNCGHDAARAILDRLEAE